VEDLKPEEVKCRNLGGKRKIFGRGEDWCWRESGRGEAR